MLSMPKLTVEGYGTFDVPADRRLVNAIERDAQGIPIRLTGLVSDISELRQTQEFG